MLNERAAQANLIGNTVVCAGAIAYQGPFTGPYRAALNAQWMSKLKEVGLDAADEPTVGHVLGDPVSTALLVRQPPALYGNLAFLMRQPPSSYGR